MFKILVPTDFSPCASYATDVALQIAAKLNGEVHLYHRTDMPPNWGELSEKEKECYPSIKTNIENIQNQLAELERQIEGKYEKAKIVSSFSYGHLMNNIVMYAEAYQIDLIVMGSHGASGLNEWLIGSNTQKIVRLAHCPVLTIKNKIEKIDFGHVVFASNFDENLKPAFRKLLDFVRHFDAHVHLLTIDTPSFYTEPQYAVTKNMETFEAMCKGKVKCTLHEQRGRSALKGLAEFVSENDMQIVAMATHGRKYLARAIMGSMAEMVVNHLDVPVLTINLQYILEHPEQQTPPFIKKEIQRIAVSV